MILLIKGQSFKGTLENQEQLSLKMVVMFFMQPRIMSSLANSLRAQVVVQNRIGVDKS